MKKIKTAVRAGVTGDFSGPRKNRNASPRRVRGALVKTNLRAGAKKAG